LDSAADESRRACRLAARTAAGDVGGGAAAGPLGAWIAIDLLGVASIGLSVGAAFYLVAAVFCRYRLR
jgi:hypothetical protein